jgi:hypothetical protein
MKNTTVMLLLLLIKHGMCLLVEAKPCPLEACIRACNLSSSIMENKNKSSCLDSRTKKIGEHTKRATFASWHCTFYVFDTFSSLGLHSFALLAYYKGKRINFWKLENYENWMETFSCRGFGERKTVVASVSCLLNVFVLHYPYSVLPSCCLMNLVL